MSSDQAGQDYISSSSRERQENGELRKRSRRKPHHDGSESRHPGSRDYERESSETKHSSSSSKPSEEMLEAEEENKNSSRSRDTERPDRRKCGENI